MNFADRVEKVCNETGSFLVAGLDPVIETFPDFIISAARAKSKTDSEALYWTLMNFYDLAFEAIQGKIAAIKPNIAFFEQYGLPGLRAFYDLCRRAEEMQLINIADIKRGDIGTTAAAYSNAYLGRTKIFTDNRSIYNVDAITINPFLGFDTVEVFVKDAITYAKGVFVLVKTSNPGSGDIQNILDQRDGQSISQKVAVWLAERGKDLQGISGFSALGAVVGATYPEELSSLRKIMPKNIFLIPGMGAQGGSAKDVANGFVRSTHNGVVKFGGALINVSRGLFSSFSSKQIARDIAISELQQKVVAYNSEISAALSEHLA